MSDFPPNLSIRPLNIGDIEACVDLERKGFPESERATEEKLRYRLTTCPELCSGMFVREYEYKYNAVNLPETAERLEKEHIQSLESEGSSTAEKAQDYDIGRETEDDEGAEYKSLPVRLSVLKETLIGHIIATKIHGNRITADSMNLPSDDNPKSGHIEHSRYIGIHGLVIDPQWQGKNLGTLLMHDYIQKLSNQDLGSKVVIIAHKRLIPFYEKIGFNNLGQSECKFAGEVWFDLSIDLVPSEDE